MSKFNLCTQIELRNGKVVGSDIDAVELCRYFSNYGSDVIIINEFSNTDEEHEKNIDLVKEIVSAIDIPVYFGGSVKRLEDVKKYLYAGASMAILDMSKESNYEMVKEASDRFGKDKIAVIISSDTTDRVNKAVEDGAALIITDINKQFNFNTL